jgi:hypothetical protein
LELLHNKPNEDRSRSPIELSTTGNLININITSIRRLVELVQSVIQPERSLLKGVYFLSRKWTFGS